MANRIKTLFVQRLASVEKDWVRLAPRERRLISGLLSVFVVGALLVCGVLVSGYLSDLEAENDEIRDALKAIARNRDEYLLAKAKMRSQEIKIGTLAPQLATDLESAARQVGVQIPETNERPASPVGRRYLEHNVDVKLRQVDLQQLGLFLKRLETGPRLIYVTRLGIRRRFAERDKLDVELTATALERLKKERPAKLKKKGNSR